MSTSAPRAYLDYNATAPLRPEARAAVVAAMDVVGNPSSVHAEGRAARRLVEDARQAIAALVGADAAQVTFTAGATEANNLALAPCLADRLLVSAIEHPSVLAGGRFPADRVTQIPVTSDGVLDLAALERQLSEATAAGERVLLALMLANNETGVIQPVAEAAARVHASGGLVHVDAVQAPGRVPVDLTELGADLLTLSAHKIGGPKGAGALIRRAGLDVHPLIMGGGQERGLRAGTENVPAIAGFGAAAVAAAAGRAAAADRMASWRDRFEAGLRQTTPAVRIFGAGVARLPNTTLFSVAGLRAETAVIAFDLEGVALSSGSACSSGKVQPSHVLAAMEPGFAAGALRVSIGAESTEAELEKGLDAWRTVSRSLGRVQRGIAA